MKRKQERWGGKQLSASDPQLLLHSWRFPCRASAKLLQENCAVLSPRPFREFSAAHKPAAKFMEGLLQAGCYPGATKGDKQPPLSPAAPGWPHSYRDHPSCTPEQSKGIITASKGTSHAPLTWPCFHKCCCHCYQCFSNDFLLICYFLAIGFMAAARLSLRACENPPVMQS